MTTAETMQRAAAACDRAAASLRAFNATFEPMIREYEEKYGPRPESEPFLEWAIRMDSNTGRTPDVSDQESRSS